MFSLHETTKMRLGRAAFVALCVVPTCAVLAWSVYVRTHAYRHAHEQAIAALTGWNASLRGASSPRPGLLVYEALELTDRENGELLARLPLIEIETHGGEVSVKLPFPAMFSGARADALWKLSQHAARANLAQRVTLAAQNITLSSPSGDQTFTEISGQVDGEADQVRAQLAFKRAGSAAGEPCQLTLTRHLDADHPSHTIQLVTGSAALPAALLAPVWPSLETFGTSCQFAGRIWASEQDGQWSTEISGQLDGIDLDQLVSHQFPHQLTGLAQARLKSLAIADGRIECASGELIAGPGVISRSLVQSAEAHLHVLAPAEALRGEAPLLAYQQLSVAFEIGPDGMTLRGQVPQTDGALLVDEHYVLAYQPPITCQPVVDLVRTLVPQSEVQVPATRESAELASRLPVPSIAPQVSAVPASGAGQAGGNPLRHEGQPTRLR